MSFLLFSDTHSTFEHGILRGNMGFHVDFANKRRARPTPTRRCWRRSSWSSSSPPSPTTTTTRNDAFQRPNLDEIERRGGRCSFRQDYSTHFSAVLQRSGPSRAQAAACWHGVCGGAAGQKLDLSRGVPGRGHLWDAPSHQVLLETPSLSRKPSISASHHIKCQISK